MLSLATPDYRYCPFCGQILKTKIEEGKNRLYCPDNHWTFYPAVAQSSAVVIINKDQVLLVKRKREPYQGSWMFPAGFVKYGEHPKEAAIREILEETGLKVTAVKLIDIFQSDDDPRSLGHLIFFFITKLNGEVNLSNGDSDENSDLRWFPINQLPPVRWHSHQIIASKIKSLVV